ncbi:P-loop containing nucleoside triphosphate hydrolase protein [Aureobasidium pullulans]|uniref:Signal recognition particle receptor subunit beta n=1 Tax=Aureobasidium pullulans TaxID=5580 RepID=A0A4S9AFJ8_AURPU|nr:P-loop containing nucleoside triphosphate hydrolase protein [Aureobasidium pullulans]
MAVDMDTVKEWLTWSFSPSLGAIVFTLLLSLSLPIIFHLFLYRQRAAVVVPSFVLLGPSGAGKTTLLTLFERGTPTATHTSQAPQTVTCNLPAGVTAESHKYRASDDPSTKKERQIDVTDTPGHGKLRQHAYDAITSATSLKGLIFVVDAAAISSPQGLAEAATYLHDILLALQKRHTGAKTSKGPAGIPVLIAANKLDLFTALPAQLVKKRLEEEITKIRSTRAKGLLDSAVDIEGDDEDREWLGEGGEGNFNFGQMKEAEIEVSVIGGNASAKGEEKTQVEQWWGWIAQQM